ncbi:protein dispatched homolog 1-like isoform X1 [Asterias amurensis]|uniref:protein dispatched homolog 1-like isoform X1 n=1 Tax=Asterias amurensis TaxID=7602 RepID=UPI003AB544AC
MIAAYSTMAFTLYDIPDFLDPVKGFEARGTVISARLKSISNTLFHSDYYLTPQVTVLSTDDNVASLSNALACNRADDPLPITNNSISGIHFGASLWDWNEQFPKIVFEGVDGVDILSMEGIRSVCSAERDFVTSHPNYNSSCLCHQEGHCLSTWSIGNYVALLSNKTSCHDINDNDVTVVVSLLRQCAPFFHGRIRSELEDASVPAECAQHDYAIHSILFFLLPWEFSETIVANGTFEKAQVTVVFFPISVSEDAALTTIYWDNLHRCTCSDGITQMKAVEFSLKNPLFATLLFADSLYLGIGSAVIFVLIWLYTGTFIVTLAAILNMVFSFLMAYFFYTVVFARPFFPFSNVLTAVLIIGIGADDAFVFIDLWKKCQLEMKGRDLVFITRETLRHATATMFVTSVTTASALYASTISDITAVKCFGIFAGTAILMNFILTLTLMPACMVLQHKVSPLICSTEGSQDDDPRNSKPRQKSCRQTLVNFARKVFEEALPSFVFKLRYLWAIIFLLLGAGGAVVIFYKPGLQLPSAGENQLFVISHPFEQYDFIYKEQFAFSLKNRPYVPAYIVWGVEALDNGDWWDPDDGGRFTPQESFTFSSPSDQQWLLNFCHDMQNQSFFNSNGPYSCFIENVKILMELPCVADPVTGQDATPCCGHSIFPYSPSVFRTCLDRFHSTGLVPSVKFKKSNSTVGVIALPFTMSYKQSLLYTLNEELWTQANTWVESQLKSAPGTLQNGWFIPYTYDIAFYDLQRSLASGTTISLLVTLGIGSVILLFSIQNIILTVNAMLTITCAVFVTVGTLVLLGWELNIVESTVITLSVGLSVDFTIHYGVAYRMAPHDDRKGRTLYFLSTMSGAISVAALSSFVGGALVMPATVYGYTQFGIFFMIVMSTSWTYSTFLFGSLCYIVGPQKSTGDIPCSSCCDCFGYSGSHTSAPVDQEMQVQEFYSPSERPLARESISTITRGRFLPIQSPDSVMKHLEGHITTANWKESNRETYFPNNNNWPSTMSKHKAGRYLEHSSSVIYSPKRSRHPDHYDGTDIHYNYNEVHFNPVYNINMR